MELIYSAFNFIVEWFRIFVNFINEVPNFLHSIVHYVLINLSTLYIETKIFLATVAMDVSRAILTKYGVYDLISLAFNKLPPDIRFTLFSFGVPEGLRLIFDAYASSLIMRFIGR